MADKLKIKDIEAIVGGMDLDSALEYLHGIKGEQNGASFEKLVAKFEKKKLQQEKEFERYTEMCIYEKMSYSQGFRFVAGVDEAGRGPLAGPVVAAAVILPEDAFIPNLNDSKKLSHKQRDYLFDIIKETAISYGIGLADEKCIDKINILNAAKKAMKDAIDQLKPMPDMVLIDAVKLDGLDAEQKNIIKGDSLSVSIAAASILAKVTRDRMIEEMDFRYPEYGFAKHKGYGTEDHINAIKKFGICPIHRISFTKNFV